MSFTATNSMQIQFKRIIIQLYCEVLNQHAILYTIPCVALLPSDQHDFEFKHPSEVYQPGIVSLMT